MTGTELCVGFHKWSYDVVCILYLTLCNTLKYVVFFLIFESWNDFFLVPFKWHHFFLYTAGFLSLAFFFPHLIMSPLYYIIFCHSPFNRSCIFLPWFSKTDGNFSSFIPSHLVFSLYGGNLYHNLSSRFIIPPVSYIIFAFPSFLHSSHLLLPLLTGQFSLVTFSSC